MSRMQNDQSLKRKQPSSNSAIPKLSDSEKSVYEAIINKKDMGTGSGQIRWETKLPPATINKAIKILLSKFLIKVVDNMTNKRLKHYMGVDFEPSSELTGGEWYSEGKLDKEYIDVLKKYCKGFIGKMKVATIEGLKDEIDKSGVLTVQILTRQIEEIVQALVLDNEVVEERSTELEEYKNIPRGMKCYRSSIKRGNVLVGGGMTSIPCGVCPRINECTLDGIISPKTCVYYQKWLDF